MSRRSGHRDMPHLEPVEKIELSDKHVGWRLGFFILFVIIAASAFAYGVNLLFSTEPGWQEVEVDSSAEANCGDEFVFMYYLGGKDTDATVEHKALKLIYTDACEMAHKLFHNKEAFDGVNNVYYINQHPNEVIEVEPALYEAFSVLSNYGNRSVYLSPVYNQYDEIFYCEDDAQIIEFDPILNDEVATDYAEIAVFANNPEMIDVKLLGENKIQLYVSEEYLAYAKENYITDFIDFFWMKNAFVTDYLANELRSRGYTSGAVSSYDGFSRSLDEAEYSYSFNIYDRQELTLHQAAVMQYNGAQSMVYLRDYMMSELDMAHYYVLSDGEVRTSYLDIADAIPKAATDNLYAYSDTLGCAEVLMQVIPIYVSDEFSEAKVSDLENNGVHVIYCVNDVIKYTEESLVLTDLLDTENMKYQTEWMQEVSW